MEDAVVLEVSASLRLFGGAERLVERVVAEAAEFGCEKVATGPNADAALVLARAGRRDGLNAPLEKLLDRLSYSTVTEIDAHSATLIRTGTKTLGDVRRLPRGGISRRFGKETLAALDRVYGTRPRAHEWLEVPDTFSARLELPGRVEVAEGLVFGARHLLTQMAGWLTARHAGITSFWLRWKHDFHRAKDIPDWGELEIRTANATRDVGHFTRLLKEQLAKLDLGASVDELVLIADDVVPLEETSGVLLLEKSRDAESVTHLTERLAARLGAENVVRGRAVSDYRPEFSQEWVPLGAPIPRAPAALPELLQPTWLMDKPVRLVMKDERPQYLGTCQPVAGPYRVEGGWWDRQGDLPGFVRRDYYVMHSEHGGLLWVYRDLSSDDDERSPWFLHGRFG